MSSGSSRTPLCLCKHLRVLGVPDLTWNASCAVALVEGAIRPCAASATSGSAARAPAAAPPVPPVPPAAAPPVPPPAPYPPARRAPGRRRKLHTVASTQDYDGFCDRVEEKKLIRISCWHSEPRKHSSGRIIRREPSLIAAEAIGRLLNGVTTRKCAECTTSGTIIERVTAKACSISALPLALTSRLIWPDERL